MRLSGERSEGSLGMPWVDSGGNWPLVLGPGVDDMERERADNEGDRAGSMALGTVRISLMACKCGRVGHKMLASRHATEASG